MSLAKKLFDHSEIRAWAEARSGKPARIKGTAEDEIWILRIAFPDGGSDDRLEEIEWDDWFDAFEENDLAMLVHDDTSDGKLNRFARIVGRDDPEEPQTLRRVPPSHVSAH